MDNNNNKKIKALPISYPNIRNIREDNDLTQSEVAKMLNCTQSAYNHYESGNREIPLKLLIQLADYYNCSVDYLLGRVDNEGNRK